MPKSPVAHQPFLRMAELPALMHALRNYGGMPQAQLGVRLAQPYLRTRRSELRRRISENTLNSALHRMDYPVHRTARDRLSKTVD